jgi:hypothetical protein
MIVVPSKSYLFLTMSRAESISVELFSQNTIRCQNIQAPDKTNRAVLPP